MNKVDKFVEAAQAMQRARVMADIYGVPLKDDHWVSAKWMSEDDDAVLRLEERLEGVNEDGTDQITQIVLDRASAARLMNFIADSLGYVVADAPPEDPQFHELRERLCIKSRQVLKRLGMQSIASLAEVHERQIEAMKNAGPATVRDINSELARYGVSLKNDAMNQ